MSPTEILAATEAIKVLKARYFRAMDTQDWDLMSRVLADDVVSDFRAPPPILRRATIQLAR